MAKEKNKGTLIGRVLGRGKNLPESPPWETGDMPGVGGQPPLPQGSGPWLDLSQQPGDSGAQRPAVITERPAIKLKAQPGQYRHTQTLRMRHHTAAGQSVPELESQEVPQDVSEYEARWNAGQIMGDDLPLYKTQVLLGRYLLVDRPPLGMGGHAIVLEAMDLRLSVNVALKVLLRVDAERLDALRREVLMVRNLRDPHVSPIYDMDEARFIWNGSEFREALGGFFAGDSVSVHFITMELLQGEPLDEWIRSEDREKGPLTLPELLYIARQIAQALKSAHADGIVHRDLKPENVMMLEGRHCKVLDFGIASAGTEQSNSEEGVLTGTPAYMAPEMVRTGTCDHRADFYSLGGLLYFAWTGHLPIEPRATAMATALAQIIEKPRPVGTFRKTPQHIEEFLLWLLEKDPEKRPESADAVLGALERFGDPVSAIVAMSALKNGRVLVVEPNPGRRRVLTHLLSSYKLFVDSVETWEEAEDRVREEPLKAVFLAEQPDPAATLQMVYDVREVEQRTTPVFIVGAHTTERLLPPYVWALPEPLGADWLAWALEVLGLTD